MSVSVYKSLREHLIEPNNVLLPSHRHHTLCACRSFIAERHATLPVSSTPPTAKPLPSKISRTLPTQTDDPPPKKTQSTQTEAETILVTVTPPVVTDVEVKSTRETLVLPIPAAKEESLLSSPSQHEPLPVRSAALPTMDPPIAIPAPPSDTHSILSGVTNWQELCNRRLQVRTMLHACE